MSSFIQWPTIYGSEYLLPGIVVAVLLLLVLLLVSSRRRTRAGRARAGRGRSERAWSAAKPVPAAAGPTLHEEPRTPAPAVAYTQHYATQPVGAASLRPTSAAAVTLVPPPVGAAQQMAAPVTMAPAAAPVAAPAAPDVDPLPLFEAQSFPAMPGSRFKWARSARKASAVQEPAEALPVDVADPMDCTIMEVLNGWGDLDPEDMKRLELFCPDRLSAALMAVELPKSKSTDTKVRLSQMRQYALGLERRAQAIQAAGTAAAAAEAAPVTTTLPQIGSAGAPSGTPTAEPLPSAVSQPHTAAQPARSFYDAEPAEPLPSVDAAPLPSVDAEPPRVEPAAVSDEPAVSWADPRPLWQPDPEPAFEETPAPTYHEIEVRPTDVPVDEAPPASLFDPPTDLDDLLAWDAEPPALSRLNVRVETAEQLLPLPPAEQVEMTAFLPPAELAATFRATRDPELKKAVIDTLERIGTPASLNALGNCFEDEDHDIQVYALAAADRLLGVA